jgi:hypothetical protein
LKTRRPNRLSARLFEVGLPVALCLACGSGGSGNDATDAAATGGHGGAPPPGDSGPGGGGPRPDAAVTAPDAGGGTGGGGGADAGGGSAGQGGDPGGNAGQGGERPDAGTGGAAGHGGEPPDAGPARCEDDAGCTLGHYCGPDGVCVPGCRDAASPCPPDAAGHGQTCDEPTHTCLPEVVCCGADSACSLTREEACDGTVLQGSFTCDAAPCGSECLSDEDCGGDRFCHPIDFRCTLGCRLGEAADCPYDETCVPETRTCGVLACDAHETCLDRAQYCDFLGALATRTCREGCRDDDACGNGGRCGADHVCVFLCDAENAQCPANHTCDIPSGQCVPTCERNDECPPDEICDGLTARCVPGCRDDAHEPDDISAEARALVFGAPDADGIQSATGDGRMCSLNPDVFSIELPPGGRFHASLDFEVDGQSFISIATPDMAFGGEIAFDVSPAEVTFPALGTAFAGGPVYLTVLSESVFGSDYTLNVDLAVGEATCFPDAHEPANETPAGAQRLARDAGAALGSVCAGDDDWFVLRLGRNDGFAVSLVSLTGGQPLSVSMYRASRVDAAPGAAPDYASGEGIEGVDGVTYEIVVPVDAAGFSDEDWYIHVQGADARALAEYRLLYAHTPSAVVCDDDAHSEPNDDSGSAIDLDLTRDISVGGRLIPDVTHVVPIDLSLCPGDADTFCLIADRDDSLSATLESVQGAGVRWLDGFGEPLTALATGHAPGEPAVPNRLGRVAGGRYCAQVAGPGGPYTLSVLREVPAMYVCASDSVETDPATGRRNDTAATATEVPAAGADPLAFAIDTGYFCDVAATEDEDWYRYVPAPAQGRLCVTIGGFAASGGDVDLEVYLPGVEVDPTACETDDTCVEGTRCVDGACLAPFRTEATRYQSEMYYRGRFTPPPGAGPELLRLRRGQPPGEGVGYRVDITNTPDTEDCPPDFQERAGNNDTPETATGLGAIDAALCSTWICPDERFTGDHYAVTVPAGEDRTVFIDFDWENEGRLFLYGNGPQPDPADGLSGFVRSEISAGGQQCINLHGGAADQTFTVQVAGDRLFASRIDYALRVVPTDLAASGAGACASLGAPDLPACPPRAQWMSFPGIGSLQPDACYGTLDAP